MLTLILCAALGQAVASTADSTERWFPDRTRSHYLTAPSALLPKRNEVTWAQTDLVLSQLSWGATDWLSLQLTTAVPAYFLSPFPAGFNGVLGARAGGRVAPHLFVAGSLQVAWVPTVSTATVPVVGLASGLITVERDRAHASLSIGVPLSGYQALRSGSPVVTLSGSVRVLPSLEVVSENWAVFALGTAPGSARTTVTLLMANGIAARLLGRRFAVDLGAVFLSSGGTFAALPVPWLSVSWAFGPE